MGLLTIVLESSIGEESNENQHFLALFKTGKINLASKGNHSSIGLIQIKEMEGHSQRKYSGQNQRSMKCTVGLQIIK